MGLQFGWVLGQRWEEGVRLVGRSRGDDEQGFAVEEGGLAYDLSFGAMIDVSWPEIDDFGWSCIFLYFFSVF